MHSFSHACGFSRARSQPVIVRDRAPLSLSSTAVSSTIIGTLRPSTSALLGT
jgi:hypothetical protein